MGSDTVTYCDNTITVKSLKRAEGRDFVSECQAVEGSCVHKMSQESQRRMYCNFQATNEVGGLQFHFRTWKRGKRDPYDE